MTTDLTFKIIAVMSPFIASTLTYFLGIKGKRKEIDFQKEKDLNIVLSNLLETWSTMKDLQYLGSNKPAELKTSLFPIDLLPKLLIKSGQINTDHFSELQKSLIEIKKYEPIVYLRLVSLSKLLDSLYSKFVLPITTNLENEVCTSINNFYLDDVNNIIELVEKIIEELSENINNITTQEVKDFLSDDINFDFDDLINQYNNYYYQIFKDNIDGFDKISFEEFVDEISKDQEFKLMIKAQIIESIENDFKLEI